MGMTLAEKALAKAAGKKSVSPGDVLTIRPDLAIRYDFPNSSELQIKLLQQIGIEKVKSPERIVYFIDHCLPPILPAEADLHKLTREWTKAQGIRHQSSYHLKPSGAVWVNPREEGMKMGGAVRQKIEVNIRAIREEDLDGVLALDRKITGRDRARTYDSVPNSYIGGEMDVSVVAEAGGEIVGFLLGRITPSLYELGDISLLQLIGVDPVWRRQGIGAKLVQAFTDRCRQRGLRSMHVMVSWHDWWLLSFLKSQGFVHGEIAEFAKPIED